MRTLKKICALFLTITLSVQVFSASVYAQTTPTSGEWGAKGENKIVEAEPLLYDYYLNNIVWDTVTISGTVVVAYLLALLPGVSVGAAGMIGALVGGVGRAFLRAERGVVLRVQLYDVSGGMGADYVYRFVSLKEQTR